MRSPDKRVKSLKTPYNKVVVNCSDNVYYFQILEKLVSNKVKTKKKVNNVHDYIDNSKGYLSSRLAWRKFLHYSKLKFYV